MTDPILPDDLANGLVDGTADISSLPTEFRGVAEVFAAAHQPASGAELAGMAAIVQHFTAAVTTSPSAADAGATTSGVIAMFGTRITKRAAIIVGATVLFAGTAAAAAGGVLPTPFSSSERQSTPTVSLESSSSEATESSQSTLEESTSSTETSVESEGLDDSTSTSFPEADFGHCTAWNNGTTKNTDNPTFSSLATEASVAGKSVDDYCTEVFAAHDAGDDHGDDTLTSNSTGNSTGNSVDDKGGQNGGGHGADDTANSTANSTGNSTANSTSNSTGNSTANSTANSTGNSTANSTDTSVDDGSGSGKGQKGKDKGSDTSNP